jgi:haloalkane dehalogenase
VQAYRTPDEQFAGLPGWPYRPRYSDQDGLRLHYADEGYGDPVLLLHGEPTSGFLYRRLVPVLGRVARVVLPDYFGGFASGSSSAVSATSSWQAG